MDRHQVEYCAANIVKSLVGTRSISGGEWQVVEILRHNKIHKQPNKWSGQ